MPRLLKVLLGATALLAAPLVHNLTPRDEIVRIVGVETKRLDLENVSRDVYFIQAETLEGRTRVYRNEDAWAYLKIDAADVQARAQAVAAERGLARVRAVGWRIRLVSMFPNALSLRRAEAGEAAGALSVRLVLSVLLLGTGGVLLVSAGRPRGPRSSSSARPFRAGARDSDGVDAWIGTGRGRDADFSDSGSGGGNGGGD